MKQLTKLSACGCLFLALAVSSGCGGGLTQKDMMRNAIRRTPDDEDDAPAPAKVVARPSGPLQADTSAPSNPGAQDIARGADTNRSASTQTAPANPTATSSIVAADTVATKAADGGSLSTAAPVTTRAPAVYAPAIPSHAAGTPLSPQAGRQQAIEKLAHLGDALEAHLQDKGHYPPPTINGARMEPLLSWRVALLPYLGHAELYNQFKLDEPWSSKHNQTLLSQIPPVFQAPGLENGKTNFLLPVGSGTAFHGRRAVTARQIEDGVENTVVLLEVDHDRAVPWTAPEDHRVNLRNPTIGLGGIREGGFLVVWGGGTVNWVPHDTPVRLLQAIFTPDAGDGILATQVGRDPLADLTPVDPDVTLADDAPSADETPQRAAAIATAPKRTAETNAIALASTNGVLATPIVERHAKPNEEALRESKDLLRELYQKEYKQSETIQEKHTLVKKMLGHLGEIEADIAGQYALLETVRQISIQVGAVEVALQAADELSTRFEIDGHRTKLDTLVGLARSAAGQHSHAIIEASQLAYEAAFAAEDYDVADQLCGIGLAAAQKLRDSDKVTGLQAQRQEVQAAKRSHLLAERAMQTLETDPRDPHASALLGKYLCLIRDDWTNGLAVLAAGDDPLLSPLAQRELGQPSRAEDQVDVGDAWWMAAEKADLGERRAMHLRAVHWYRLATPNLPPGLFRVKVERRLREFEKWAGNNVN